MLSAISVKVIIINPDAEFDSENLHFVCEQKEIIANIAHNKRNSSEDSHRLDGQLSGST